MRHLEFCQNKFPCETASSANTVRVLANAVSMPCTNIMRVRWGRCCRKVQCGGEVLMALLLKFRFSEVREGGARCCLAPLEAHRKSLWKFWPRQKSQTFLQFFGNPPRPPSLLRSIYFRRTMSSALRTLKSAKTATCCGLCEIMCN